MVASGGLPRVFLMFIAVSPVDLLVDPSAMGKSAIVLRLSERDTERLDATDSLSEAASA